VTNARARALVAVVPMKPFDRAKSRLAAVLSEDERCRLAEALFVQTVRILVGHPDITETIVVSAGAAVLDRAQALGACPVREPGGAGLNGALDMAASAASDRGAERVLFLPADLPLLTADDVSLLAAAMPAAGRDVVIAPDRHRSGTNALLVRPPGLLQTQFGPQSFMAHCAAATRLDIEARVVESPALGLDIDEAADLALVPEDILLRLMPRAIGPL
jgi:2-phospho-L-lactate/phosphoenolpyruvate guanylyltransferase